MTNPDTRVRARWRFAGMAVLAMLAIACAPRPASTFGPSAISGSASPSAAASPDTSPGKDLVIVGRIVTMAQPLIAEALLIEDGVVTAVGSRAEVLPLAGRDVAVLDIGEHVAYPGFIDAHAHWIGDRESYGRDTPAAAMDEALSRGWTSISEQWVNPERLTELEGLDAADALPLRVDAYLTLNEPYGGAHLGDWYVGREPGAVSDHLRVRGLKMHLDNEWGTLFNWEADDLTAAIGRADAAGWQVSVHTVSKEAHDIVLHALESAIGPDGPNPLHHRIEHATQVTDAQLARMVAMDLSVVVHLDAAAADWVLEPDYLGHLGPDANPGEEAGWLTRWRDFVDAGLHVAGASDAPWIFPGISAGDYTLPDEAIGRPVDQIAGGMDARGRANPVTPAWMDAQHLTAEQGLRAVTVEAAWALGDEARRGHLAPGTFGDVTILSSDVLADGVTPDEIRAADVLATVVGGGVA